MYIVLAGCAQQGASPPFAASLDIASLQDIADMSAPASGSIATFTTLSGVLDAHVIPSGGSGSYTFSWSVNKIFENSDNGNRFSVNTLGTTNVSQYRTLTIDGARPANAGDVYEARFEATCTASDGVTNIDVVVTFTVTGAAF